MSYDEKVIIYDNLPARVGLLLCNLTLPLWGVIAPAVVAFIITYSITILLMLGGADHSDLSVLDTFRMIGTTLPFLLMLYLGILLTGLLQDDHIVVTSQGLKLPVLTSLMCGLDNFIEWSDVQKVLLLGDEQSSGSQKLKVISKNRAVVLELKNLALDDIEHILVSFSTFMASDVLDPKLEALKEKIWNSDNLSLAPSFTQMWEEELASRFAATAYIPLSPGRKLQDGSLKIVRQLAFGGWSAIYLVRKSNTMRVLKESVIPQGASEELKTKALAMFEKEAQLLQKINHPAIVKVHQHFIEEQRHYLLLDYVSGQTLRQKIKLEGAMHALDALDCAAQIASILQYLHNQKPAVLHRDLTPDNLIIDNDGKLVLIDFGAANELIGTATGTLVGKQSYISPEQFAGHATTSSDMYALGATMYFLLTAEDPEPLTQSQLPNSDILPSALSLLVFRLTAQLQTDRPQLSEVIDQVSALLGIRPVSS